VLAAKFIYIVSYLFLMEYTLCLSSYLKLLESLGFDWEKRSRSKKGSSPHVDAEPKEQPDAELEEKHDNESQPAHGEWA